MPPMSHRNPPPLLHVLHHTTTATQILRQTTSLFFCHLLTFLFPAFLLFTFRLNVHTAAHTVSSLIDRHASSLKPLLARDDDFFSQGSHTHRSLFRFSPPKSLPNATLVTLSDFNPGYGFSNSVVDNGVRIVRPGTFSFKPEFKESMEEEEIKFVESSSDDGNAAVELDFDPFSSPFFVIGVICTLYANILLAFIITYAWAHGVIFIKVVNHLVGKYRSFFGTVCHGSLMGLMRISGVILMKWTVLDTLAMLVGLPLFWEVKDEYVFVKVFFRMQFMPFVDLVPWVTGHERESGVFIVVWFLIDLIMGLKYAVDSWDAIMDARMRMRVEELVRGRRNLLVGLPYPVFGIRWLEAIICGSIGRWMLRGICGEVLTMVFQSLMEVYFMVAWLVFCTAARHGYDSARGRTFGQRELEGLLNVNI